MSSTPLDLAQREAQLTAKLDALQEQRWEQSETSYERSEIRFARGDHPGALEDAKVALALFPSHTKYLLRASHAHLKGGSSDEAYRLFEQAKDLAISQGNSDKATSATLRALDRCLRPFEYIPNEVVANIFVFVHQDFEGLPSPYQLTQVCKRWREITRSTRSLWCDTRILRVREEATTTHDNFSPVVKKPYRWSQTGDPSRFACNQADTNKFAQLRDCASLSHNSLTHFELDVHGWNGGYEGFRRIFDLVEPSMSTLESLAFIHAHVGERRPFAYAAPSSERDFAAVSLAFVLRCPKLVDVRLSVGQLIRGGTDQNQWPFAAKAPHSNASFRRLELDSFGGLTTTRRWAGVRECLLQRSSQLRHLALCNVPNVDMRTFTKDNVPLALDLLATCADTLVELDISGESNPLIGARAIGLKSFPQLRRLRYVPPSGLARTAKGDMDDIAFPKLESIEAPIDLILALDSVPRCVTLRLVNWAMLPAECKIFAAWLCDLEEDQSPQAVTILVTSNPGRTDACLVQRDASFCDSVLDALTPPPVGKVACPKLTELKVIHRAAYLFDRMGLCHSLDPAPLPEPLATTFVRKLLQMQRRRAFKVKPQPSDSSPLHSGETSPKRQKLSSAETADARCEALCKIELEGFCVSADEWAAMKASKCHYQVTPSPDDLARRGS